MTNITVRFRYADPALLALGEPPDLASKPYEELNSEAISRLVPALDAAGAPLNTQMLETDPAVILTEDAVYRDVLRRREIDDAVAQTYLGSATGASLDHRAADYGVLRRALPHTINEAAPANRPADVPPAWSWDGSIWHEDDSSLRQRARLAWEALSVAGPNGAYVFHALDAHPATADAIAYGPESGIVDPGEVLVVVQSHLGDGTASEQVLRAIAERLDAVEIISGTGASTMRPVRDDQAVRPLGARVTIQSCQILAYDVVATLFVRAGADPEVIRGTGETRLRAYLARRARIGREVPLSGMVAAAHVAGSDYLPVAEEVAITTPAADVLSSYYQLPRIANLTVSVEVV